MDPQGQAPTQKLCDDDDTTRRGGGQQLCQRAALAITADAIKTQCDGQETENERHDEREVDLDQGLHQARVGRMEGRTQWGQRNIKEINVDS